MGVRRVLAALCIVGMIGAGIGLAVFIITQSDSMRATPPSTSLLATPTPKVPAVEEFKIGVEVTGQQCADGGVCTYTYTIKPQYVGFHPLPEQDITVFYEITGGNQPQPGNFTVSNGQARVYKDVTLEGPPGVQLEAVVTRISLVAGPKPVPSETIPPESLIPEPIN
jgi:hypothetical protein